MLVKFSGHNFSSFLLCPGGPVRLGGKEGKGERSRREPAGAAAPGPGPAGPAARAPPRRRRRRGYSPGRQAQAVQEGDGETRGHGDGWLLGRNHLCMPYFTPGHVKRLVRGGEGARGPARGRRRRQPPAALHARRPGCQAPGAGGGAASFPAPLTLSGQQAPVPAAPPAPTSAPPRPRPRAPPRSPLPAARRGLRRAPGRGAGPRGCGEAGVPVREGRPGASRWRARRPSLRSSRSPPLPETGNNTESGRGGRD